MDYVDLIISKFTFLINQYSFEIDHQEFDLEFFGNTIVRFANQKTGFKVVIDRSEVTILLGEITDKDEDWFDIIDVVKFFAPQIDPVYIFPKNLLPDESIQFQVERLSHIAQGYCVSILKGDFSMKAEIAQIRAKREQTFINEMKRKYPQLRN